MYWDIFRKKKERMEQAFKDGAAAAVAMMNDGVDTAMNRFNGAARTVKKRRKNRKPKYKKRRQRELYSERTGNEMESIFCKST